jgi:hypothetical protein
LSDANNTFQELRKERIRHHFWHIQIDPRAMNYAERKGRIALDERVDQVVRGAIGRDGGWDGRQTGMVGNPIYYGQHATATCCRKCVEEWHGIPRGRDLNEDEIAYLGALVRLYLRERLPDLSLEGKFVPPLREAGAEGEPE